MGIPHQQNGHKAHYGRQKINETSKWDLYSASGDKLRQKLQPRRGRGRDEGGARGLAEMTSQGVDMKVREEVDQAEGAKDLGQ